MEFGFSLPSGGPIASPGNIITLARRGEALGFGFLGVSDHVVLPKDIQSRYPYNPHGKYGGSSEYLEPLALLSFVAAQTSRVRLVPSVLVLPYRGPVLTAKILASIDVLSQGRLTLGCGTGWMREEFKLLGSPSFEERGKVTDEYLMAFKELWTSDSPAFSGEHVSFSDLGFFPKPVQKPHPPIWVGGESPRALRRVARFGDGWFPIGTNPAYPVGTERQLADAISRLHRYVEEEGRDPAGISIAYNASWPGTLSHSDIGAKKSLLAGTAEEMLEDINNLGQMGVSHIRFGFDKPTLTEMIEDMECFAENLMPST